MIRVLRCLIGLPFLCIACLIIDNRDLADLYSRLYKKIGNPDNY